MRNLHPCRWAHWVFLKHLSSPWCFCLNLCQNFFLANSISVSYWLVLKFFSPGKSIIQVPPECVCVGGVVISKKSSFLAAADSIMELCLKLSPDYRCHHLYLTLLEDACAPTVTQCLEDTCAPTVTQCFDVNIPHILIQTIPSLMSGFLFDSDILTSLNPTWGMNPILVFRVMSSSSGRTSRLELLTQVHR